MNELSLIIPCISSVDVLSSFIDRLASYLMTNPSDMNIIVVANEKVRFTERVAGYVREKYPWLKFEVLQRKGEARHYGALARFGIAYSTGRYAVLVSPYGEDDIGLLNSMLGKIRKGAQVVQATRYASSAEAKSVPMQFRIYQAIYRLLTSMLLGVRISDSTYSFKMFDRVFIEAMGLTQNSYSICPEITFKALLAGGKVEYIPSTMKSNSPNRDFKLHQEGVKYLWVLFRAFAHRIGILWF